MINHRRSVSLPILLLTLFISAAALSAQEHLPPVAILGAMDEEVAWLRSQMHDTTSATYSGRTFVSGRLGSRLAVIAVTGVGKVNAAMTTTLLADHFHPAAVIFSGVAGGMNPDLFPGDIVIASRTMQHDLGEVTADSVINWGVRNPATKKVIPTYLTADSVLLSEAEKAAIMAPLEKVPTTIGLRHPKVITGLIATGDMFISSTPKKNELRRRLAPDAIEMEGAAVAQVCYELGLPCLIIRSLSDRADENALQDFEKFYQVAARNANRIVLEMVGP
jgi:adenosylhomocysteine nucleosidase